LHQPGNLTLILRNPASGKAANLLVSMEPDENFVSAGMKSGRVGILPPGEGTELLWRVVPMECGWVETPKVKVVNVRDEESGKEVLVKVEVPKILVLP
jgi:trafficking protein particle complex subunit 11